MEVRPFLLDFYCPFLWYKVSRFFANKRRNYPLIACFSIYYMFEYQAFCSYLTFIM